MQGVCYLLKTIRRRVIRIRHIRQRQQSSRFCLRGSQDQCPQPTVLAYAPFFSPSPPYAACPHHAQPNARCKR